MKTKPIKSLFRIIGGQAAPKGDDAYSSTGIPFVKMKDLGRYHVTNNLENVENYVHPHRAEKFKLKLVKKGAILLPRSGSVALNHRAILGVDAYIVSHICALEVIDRNVISNEYAYYYLRTVTLEKITKKTTGLDAITFEDLGKLDIPLPPLEDQVRIATVLTRAEQLIAKRKESITALDALLKSTFLEMFGDPVRNEKGWEVKKLGLGASVQGGFAFKSKDLNDKAGIKLLKIANVHFEKADWAEKTYMPENSIDTYGDFSLNEGDIAIALTRPIIKSLDAVKTVRISFEDLPCLLNQRVGRFRIDIKYFNGRFLQHLLHTQYFKNEIARYCSTALQPNVSTSQIESILVYYPPLSLQDQYAAIVEKVEALKAKYQQSLVELENLYGSLSQRAFNGELDLSGVRV